MPQKKDAGVVASAALSRAASRSVASNARLAPATVYHAPAAAIVVRKALGPAWPPVRKQKRKTGLAIASLEVDDMFARGDWAGTERFETCRLPMFSVAWSTLKEYESFWKHWCAFQYYARLPIFLEVESAAKRKRSSGVAAVVCCIAGVRGEVQGGDYQEVPDGDPVLSSCA